jgi:hypothetical protein
MFAGDRPLTGVHPLRRPLVLLALLVLAPVLAACGGSDGGSGSAQAPGFEGGTLSAKDLALVADRTTAEGGMRMSIEQTMSLGSQGTIPARGEGSFDNKSRRGEMTLSMDVSNLPGGGALDGGGGAVQQHMVFDGSTFYMRSPAFDAVLPSGKRWLKFDLARAGKEIGVDFSTLMQGANSDPTQTLQYLKAAGGDVKRVGTETVRGTSTTHYRTTVDFEKVPDGAPAGERAAMRKSIQQIIKLSGTKTVPIDVWVGDDGIARRIVSSYGSNIGGERTTIKQRIEMYDFGAKIDVKIPPDDETFDFSQLGELLQGAGSGSTFG